MADEPRKNEWKAPFRRYAQTMGEISRLMDLTYEGVSRIIHIHEIHKITSEFNEDEDRLERLKETAARAEMAQSEEQNEFPVLHGHSIMGAWSALEALVEDLAVSWTLGNPEILSFPAVAKIKVPLAEFMTFDEEDRIRYLVGELQRDLKVDLKNGANKFETLFDAIGLGGQLDSRVRRSLYETQQMRNLLAHRAGIVDRRFIEACPWFGLEIGEQLRIGREACDKSFNGMNIYMWTVMNRCFVKVGRRAVKRECPAGFEGALDFLDSSNREEVTD